MEVTEDLKGARFTVAKAAELANMHPAHFRRLCRRGIFPPPKRTAKGRPYVDYDLLMRVARILKSGVGENGQEVIFYRRKSQSTGKRSERRRDSPAPDPYLRALGDGLKQLGIAKKELRHERLVAVLTAEFGAHRPELSVSIPAVLRRLLG